MMQLIFTITGIPDIILYYANVVDPSQRSCSTMSDLGLHHLCMSQIIM